MSNEEISEGMREALTRSMERVKELQGRLASQESRISQLQGRRGGLKPAWDDTLARADAVIAAVASIEIASANDQAPGFRPSGHDEAALARTGLSQDDLVRLSGATTNSQMGAVNLIQGHLGEQIALDLINSGKVPIPDGRLARLASSPNQPGYDLDLVDPDGNQATLHAQVKIADSANAIREHFARYPGVNVVYANTDAAQQMAHDHGVTVIAPGAHFPQTSDHVVVDMGISHADVRSEAFGLLHNTGHETMFHKALEDIPIISLILIAGRAAGSYLKTDIGEGEIMRTAGRRVRDILIASGLSQATTAVTAEPATGSLTAMGYLLLGNAIRQARGDLDRAADRFMAMKGTLSQISGMTA
jgi:hypothetical protein